MTESSPTGWNTSLESANQMDGSARKGAGEPFCSHLIPVSSHTSFETGSSIHNRDSCKVMLAKKHAFSRSGRRNDSQYSPRICIKKPFPTESLASSAIGTLRLQSGLTQILEGYAQACIIQKRARDNIHALFSAARIYAVLRARSRIERNR